jgi:Tfp pilus assembly protein PilN
MAQQINLYTPRLLKPQRIFSAQTMAWALAGLTLLLVLFCAGVLLLQRARHAEYDSLSQRQAAERQQLTAALQSLKQHNDPAVIGQQLQAIRAELAQLQAQTAAQAHWQLAAGQHHSSLLQLLAHSTPPAVWITALDAAPDHLTLHGLTIDPAALPGWVALLQDQPALGGRALSSVQVEQPGLAAERNGPASLPLPAGAPVSADQRTPVWAFRLATTAPAGTSPETAP